MFLNYKTVGRGIKYMTNNKMQKFLIITEKTWDKIFSPDFSAIFEMNDIWKSVDYEDIWGR